MKSAQQFLRTLGSLLGPTRAAAGCMQAHLYADVDKRKTLFLVEEWESREHFERNLDTTKLNTIVAAIELSSEAPVVCVDSVEREGGWIRWHSIGPPRGHSMTSTPRHVSSSHRPVVRCEVPINYCN